MLQVVLLTAAGLIIGSRPSSSSDDLGNRHHVASALGFVLGVFTLLRWGLNVDDDVMHHTQALKALFILASFCGLSFFDARRHLPIPPRVFLIELALATAYVMPVFPLIAVGISTGFLLLVTLVQALRLPDSWLNGPIYYGTFYGPAVFIYLEVGVPFGRVRS